MSINTAVYSEGCMYPSLGVSVEKNITALQKSGFETVILSLFHVGRDYDIDPPQNTGDLYYNDTLVISKGEYVGCSSWPQLVASIRGGSTTRVCASIGGGGVLDFTTIKEIYLANQGSFANTNLEQCLRTFRNVFPAVDTIDMDNEDCYFEPSFIAFCRMVIDLGFQITFCPYAEQTFWVNVLSALNITHPGAVVWWNLQCYDGGAGNSPELWAQAVRAGIPDFDTNGYILVGDWTSDSPAQVDSLMSSFAFESSVGGGFMWTLDAMLHGPVGPHEYAAAIKAGLNRMILTAAQSA